MTAPRPLDDLAAGLTRLAARAWAAVFPPRTVARLYCGCDPAGHPRYACLDCDVEVCEQHRGLLPDHICTERSSL